MDVIGIIGAGRVGSTAAFCIAKEGIAEKIVLIDAIKDLSDGEAEDINQAMPLFEKQIIVTSEDYEQLSDCYLVIITAGARRKPDETRLSLIKKNKALIDEIIQKITSVNKNCILFIVTNPVDILTYFSLKGSSFPKERVFGLGTYIDTLRLRSFIKRRKLNNKDAIVIGEHGDTMVFVKFSEEEIMEKVRNAGAYLIKTKGGCGWAVGMAVFDVAKAILLDEKKVFPLSSYFSDMDICISLPVEIGREGIIGYPEIDLSPNEKSLFLSSAEAIKREIEICS